MTAHRSTDRSCVASTRVIREHHYFRRGPPRRLGLRHARRRRRALRREPRVRLVLRLGERPPATASGSPCPVGGGANTSKVIVSSVSFKDGVIREAGKTEFPGYGGIFNVTRDSILLAHDVTYVGDQGGAGSPTQPPQKSELQYIDIHDAAGAIALRGKVEVPGSVQSWGADNGRWNLDLRRWPPRPRARDEVRLHRQQSPGVLALDRRFPWRPTHPS